MLKKKKRHADPTSLYSCQYNIPAYKTPGIVSSKMSMSWKTKKVRSTIKREQSMATQCKMWYLIESCIWRNFSSYNGLY